MSVVLSDSIEHSSTNPAKDNNAGTNYNGTVAGIAQSNQQRTDENEDGINHRASLTYQNKIQLLQIFLHLRPVYLDPTMSKANFWQRVNDEISRMLDIPFKSSVYTIKRLVKRRKAQLAHQQKYLAAGVTGPSGNVSSAVFRKVALDELVDKVIQVFQEERSLKRKTDGSGGVDRTSAVVSGGAAGNLAAVVPVPPKMGSGITGVEDGTSVSPIDFGAISSGNAPTGSTAGGVEQLYAMIGSMRRTLDHQSKVIEQQSKVMELLVKEVKELREGLQK